MHILALTSCVHILCLL